MDFVYCKIVPLISFPFTWFSPSQYLSRSWLIINSLWHHRWSRSLLLKVMTWYLMAPWHYLKPCKHFTEDLWQWYSFSRQTHGKCFWWQLLKLASNLHLIMASSSRCLVRNHSIIFKRTSLKIQEISLKLLCVMLLPYRSTERAHFMYHQGFSQWEKMLHM